MVSVFFSFLPSIIGKEGILRLQCMCPIRTFTVILFGVFECLWLQLGAVENPAIVGLGYVLLYFIKDEIG